MRVCSVSPSFPGACLSSAKKQPLAYLNLWQNKRRLRRWWLRRRTWPGRNLAASRRRKPSCSAHRTNTRGRTKYIHQNRSIVLIMESLMKERERGTDQQRQTHTQKGAAARTGAKCKRNKARRKGGGARSHRNYCCCCDTHATNYTCAAITSRTQRDVALIVFFYIGGFGLNPL